MRPRASSVGRGWPVTVGAALLFGCGAPPLRVGEEVATGAAAPLSSEARSLCGDLASVASLEGAELVLVTFDEGCSAIYGLRVASSGAIATFFSDDHGAKGSSAEPIEPRDVTRLAELVAKLPPSSSPTRPDATLVLRATGAVERVYDRANLPGEVLEILRLTRGVVRPELPSFAPSARLACGSHGREGAVALSPDGRTAVCAFTGTVGKVWDVATRGEIARLPETESVAPRALAFSADGKMLAVAGFEILILDARTWKVVRRFEPDGGAMNAVSFTPDGKLLLAATNYQDRLFAYDVSSWRRLAEVPNAPPGARRYFQSASGALAVVGTREENLVLWDRAARRVRAALDADRLPLWVAFSPDESKVAVVERLGGDCRENECETPIKVWDVRGARLLHELRPFEVTLDERIEGLAWTPDGEHILAVARPAPLFSSREIAVWSATTGRHRARLTGPSAAVRGLSVTPDGQTVVVASDDANVYVWDFDAAMKRLASSGPGHPP